MTSVTTAAGTGGKVSARERLLAAADELFYREGVQTVGIDRIIEHAGVAKASLYNCFGSKEELIRAYLQRRQDRNLNRLRTAVEGPGTPRERLLAVFDSQRDLFLDPNYHGCAFVAASAEAPAGGVVEQVSDEYRAAARTLFVGLAREAGMAGPESFGRTIHLLYDGAMLSARMDRDRTAALAAKDAAAALFDVAVG